MLFVTNKTQYNPPASHVKYLLSSLATAETQREHKTENRREQSTSQLCAELMLQPLCVEGAED